jgi:uncharacterized protein
LKDVEWDLAKAEANFLKHQIAFADAVAIFNGPHLSFTSDRYGETRYVSVGYLEDLAIAVVWTLRDPEIRRIISARRARREERRAYRQNVTG